MGHSHIKFFNLGAMRPGVLFLCLFSLLLGCMGCTDFQTEHDEVKASSKAKEEIDSSKMPPDIRKEIESFKSPNLSLRLEAIRNLQRMGLKARAAVPFLVNLLGDDTAVEVVIKESNGGGKSSKFWRAQDVKTTTTFAAEAAEALIAIGEPALESVLEIANHDRHSIKSKAVYILAAIKSPQALEQLRRSAIDDDPEVKLMALNGLAQQKDRQALPIIMKALQDGKSTVREKAAWALGEIEDEQSVLALVEALDDRVDSVSEAAARSLGKIKDQRSLRPLIRAWKKGNNAAVTSLSKMGQDATELVVPFVSSKDRKIRSQAIWILGEIRDLQGLKPVMKALDDVDALVRENAASALGKLGDKRSVAPLIRLTRDAEASVRVSAVYALGLIGHPSAVQALIKATEDEDPEVQQEAEEAIVAIGELAVDALVDALKNRRAQMKDRAASLLGEIGQPKAAKPLIEALKSKDKGFRLTVIAALGMIDHYSVRQQFLYLLKNGHAHERAMVAEMLGKRKDQRSCAQLIAALRDKDEDVRQAANDALVEITGHSFDDLEPNYKKWQAWWKANNKRFD